MEAKETTSNSHSLIFPAKAERHTKHRYRFSSVKDSRNRKVRGLWKRGERLYMQTRVSGERSARDSGKKTRTIDREGHSLVHWIAAIGNIRLDKITKPMITHVIKSRLEAGIKPRTVNIDVIVLRNVLKEAKDDRLIVHLPTEGIRPKKVKTPVRSLLSPTAFEELCKAAADCRKNRVQLLDYLRLLAYSGARRDEALALKWN